jgi:1,4-dihydroxy-2-naphthoyl-CoA hydrolase
MTTNPGLAGANLASAPREQQAWIDAFDAIRPYTAMGPLGATCVSIDDDHVTLKMTISDAARQPFGLLHGGVSLLLAETAASFHSAWLADLGKVAPVGVDINGTHLSSATDGTVLTTARVLRRAQAFVFHEVELTHVETGKILCKSRVTNYLRPLTR